MWRRSWLAALLMAGHAFAQYVPYPTKTPTRVPPPMPTPTAVPPAVPTPRPTATLTPIPQTPTPTPTYASAGFPNSNCVRGEVCFRIELSCVPAAEGCTTTVRYLRQFRMDVGTAIVP